MKILNKEDVGKYTLYTLLLDNNTTTTVSIVNDNRDEKEIMKDIRILTKDTVGEPFVGITDVEDYVFEDSKPTLMYVDFNNLTGEVYDQYAELMKAPIEFIIEGTDKVRIENGQLIEDEVDTDTSYFVVAKCGDLEKRQERTIYAPREADPIDGINEDTLKRIAELEELLNKVDNDLNALVGGSDE